jgi:hypothetical protein
MDPFRVESSRPLNSVAGIVWLLTRRDSYQLQHKGALGSLSLKDWLRNPAKIPMKLKILVD